MKKFGLIIKRLFDIICALGGIIVLSPIFIICAILIKTNLGNPIFFRQRRIGKGNKEFEMIKFRTMKDAFDKKGNTLPDDQRIQIYCNKVEYALVSILVYFQYSPPLKLI